MKIANWSKEIIIVPGLKLQKDDDLLSLLRGYTLEHTQCCKQMLAKCYRGKSRGIFSIKSKLVSRNNPKNQMY